MYNIIVYQHFLLANLKLELRSLIPVDGCIPTNRGQDTHPQSRLHSVSSTHAFSSPRAEGKFVGYDSAERNKRGSFEFSMDKAWERSDAGLTRQRRWIKFQIEQWLRKGERVWIRGACRYFLKLTKNSMVGRKLHLGIYISCSYRPPYIYEAALESVFNTLSSYGALLGGVIYSPQLCSFALRPWQHLVNQVNHQIFRRISYIRPGIHGCWQKYGFFWKTK